MDTKAFAAEQVSLTWFLLVKLPTQTSHGVVLPKNIYTSLHNLLLMLLFILFIIFVFIMLYAGGWGEAAFGHHMSTLWDDNMAD